MNRVLRSAILCASLFALTQRAQALNTRTWVSGSGVDQANCGPIASPCRTLQYAHDNTTAGGEVDVLDSAGYGAVVISKSITIVGDGSIAGVLAASGFNAITINAGAADTVVLRGLTVEGAGVGYSGIRYNSGGALTIANCLVQNFAGHGVEMILSSGSSVVEILNTTTSYNALNGVSYRPASGSTAKAKLTIDRLISTHNQNGILLLNDFSSGGLTANVSNSLVANNSGDGFYLQSFSGPLSVSVGLSSVTGNVNNGISVWRSTTTLILGRSTLASNKIGFANNSGVAYSYRDNHINGNTSADISGALTTLTAQ